jgi:hypothetical protein
VDKIPPVDDHCYRAIDRVRRSNIFDQFVGTLTVNGFREDQANALG